MNNNYLYVIGILDGDTKYYYHGNEESVQRHLAANQHLNARILSKNKE